MEETRIINPYLGMPYNKGLVVSFFVQILFTVVACNYVNYLPIKRGNKINVLGFNGM